MGCTLHQALPAKRDPVSVNGVVITRDLIARETQNHSASTPIKAWTAAAQAMVVRELLLQEARRLDLRPEPRDDGEGRRETDEEAMIRALIEREVATPVADEDACRRYYERNRRRFRSADLYEAAHILIAARQADRQGYAVARDIAADLIRRLRKQPALFADLARAHSACPSAAQGGNLGQLSAGQTTPEFERALMALAPGDLSEEPVATRYGFHVIRLDRRIAGRELPFEAVAGRIADYLSESVRRRAVAQYIARLVARAAITGVEMAGAEEHRVN